ncbi:hypothetical protein GCM10023238_17250 [Streptomyces heliomycini]
MDALTARHALEPAAPAGSFGVRLYADGTVVRVEDDGVGLTEADVHTFLATIGRSSKRAMGVPPDEPIRGWGKITEQRDDFIGRFGIGLLSCFLVADEIHVLSRSARTPDAPAVEWRGRGDGSYTVRVLPASAHPRPGTTVTLAPRADAGEWTRPAQVHALGRHFGSLLRHPVTFDDGTGAASVNPEPAPWARTYPTPGARSRALAAYGEEVLGFEPLDTVELDLPAVGLKGIACVLPETVPAGRSHGHRVHVKGMLLSEQAEEILPEWAFFVRCVIDAESLRPTASRESLYEDDTLAAVRDALAERLRAWIARAAASDPDLLARFLQVHHLAVKSLAVHDDEILRMLLPWLPFETTDGHTTLDEFARTHRTVLVTSSVEEFRQVAAIASAAGLGVVNGGYTYDRELVHRLPEIRSEAHGRRPRPGDPHAHLDPVDRETELAAGAYLAQARDALAVFDCDVALRTFQPASAPRPPRRQPRGPARTHPLPARPRAGGRPVGRPPRRPAPGGAAGPADPQPAQPAGPHRRRHRRARAGPHQRRGPLRAGRAAVPAAAQTRRVEPHQPLLPRPPRPRPPQGQLTMPTAPQTTDELYRALQENHRRPYGLTRTVTAEELVDAAERFAEPVPLVRALFELQEAYTYGSEPRKSPVVFARLLTLFDEQPDVFDDRMRHTLFWRFKWVANALRALPEIPLAGLRQWLTEMRDRYEKAGLGLQPYYGQAYQLAAHVGEDTALAYELWAGRARTRLSDCEACEICERALYHLAAGDDERALRAWEPVLAGKESCQEEPARSFSYALLPLLRAGRTDQARELHLAGYRGCRRNPSMAGEAGRHLEFCALTATRHAAWNSSPRTGTCSTRWTRRASGSTSSPAWRSSSSASSTSATAPCPPPASRAAPGR